MDKEFFDWLDGRLDTIMQEKIAAPMDAANARKYAELETKLETLFIVKEKLKDAMYREASQ